MNVNNFNEITAIVQVHAVSIHVFGKAIKATYGEMSYEHVVFHEAITSQFLAFCCLCFSFLL